MAAITGFGPTNSEEVKHVYEALMTSEVDKKLVQRTGFL